MPIPCPSIRTNGYMRPWKRGVRWFAKRTNSQQLEALSCGLSIVTLRYVPADLRQLVGSAETEEYLNLLNKDILSAIETSGDA